MNKFFPSDRSDDLCLFFSFYFFYDLTAQSPFHGHVHLSTYKMWSTVLQTEHTFKKPYTLLTNTPRERVPRFVTPFKILGHLPGCIFVAWYPLCPHLQWAAQEVSRNFSLSLDFNVQKANNLPCVSVVNDYANTHFARIQYLREKENLRVFFIKSVEKSLDTAPLTGPLFCLALTIKMMT